MVQLKTLLFFANFSLYDAHNFQIPSASRVHYHFQQGQRADFYFFEIMRTEINY